MVAGKGALDLFTPVVSESRQHPNFVRIAKFGLEEEKRVLDGWADGFVDRDGKFVIEFQTTFNSSFWELYVHAVLRDVGSTMDFRFERPDFVVESGPFGKLVAECVIASSPQAGLPEWSSRDILDETPRADLLDLASLRLAQAVVEKERKWRDSYSKLPQCRDLPYVVCVAPFDQPGGHSQGTEAIDRVLFGGPRPIFELDSEGQRSIVGHSTFNKVFKTSGATVNLGLLLNRTFSGVSGVLFSSLATWSKVSALAEDGETAFAFRATRLFHGRGMVLVGGPKPDYHETLIDGAHVFVNPHADHPLDPEVWKRLGFTVHYHRPGGTVSDFPDGVLVSRQAIRVRHRTPGQPGIAANLAPPGALPVKRTLPPDGVLFGGPSRVPGVDDIELMLYRGWTVVVGRHVDDDTWQSRYRRGAFLSVQEFFATGEDGEGASPCRHSRLPLIEETKRYLDRVIDGEPETHGSDDG